MLAVGVGRAEVLDQLSTRERAVLELMAQGSSNRGICRQLWLSDKTVESHVRMIFRKLGLGPDATTHRRVQAVLAWLEASQRESSERRT